MPPREILEGPLVPPGAEGDSDQEKRRKIAVRSDLDTGYHPVNDWLMIVPIQGLTEKGGIIIPGMAQRDTYEGHIVEMGPEVDTSRWQIGDCVCWESNGELKLKTDGDVRFVIVRPQNIILRMPASELQ